MTWDTLELRCKDCRKCPLAAGRTQVVFGAGQKNAEVLFVGEGPGEHEDLQGKPFVGRAGQLLDDMLSLIGLSRDKNFYIANIVKCRPPQNRDPMTEEQDACIGWLEEQIALLRPRVVVCLGRVAAARLIREDFRITAEHGQWSRRGDAWITAIYHPAALLRDPAKKPETFADLRAIREKIREVCSHTY
jgi:DNA polymerase